MRARTTYHCVCTYSETLANIPLGSTFVFALLIYVVYRRRRGATYAQILHVPPKAPGTPQLTPTPMRQKFSKHPIYRDLQYSIRSSRHVSTSSWPPRVHMNTSAPTGKTKHKRIESGWKDPDVLPATPTKDVDRANRSTFYFDASPVTKPRVPEKAHVSVRPLSQLSHSSSITKLPSVAEASISTDHASRAMSPLDSPPLVDDVDNRWSWTNSQAPSTPRVRPTSRRYSYASKSSAPRFRSVVSWARGQGERIRIDEEAPPLLPTQEPKPTSTPILQAVPANKRAFKDSVPPNLSAKKSQKSKGTAKGHQKATSSLGTLGAFFKSTKSTSNLPSSTTAFGSSSNMSKSTGNLGLKTGDLESGQAATDIELKERQR